MKTHKVSFKILFTLSVIFITVCSYAQTHEISGTINTNTTWDYDTVKVTGNLTVADNVTLTILPGTYVEFQEYYKLSVVGRVIAKGTAEDSIIFTVNDTSGFWNINTQEGGWHGIHFDGWLNYGLRDNIDTSYFEYCRIEFGKSTGPSINWGDGEAYGGAFLIRYFSNVVISHCRLENNKALWGGAVYIQTASPVIEFNTITGSQSLNAAVNIDQNSNSLLLSSNNISNNYCQGIFIYGSNSLIINNIIANNIISKGNQMGGGILLMSCKPIVINNTICNNSSSFKGGGLAFQNAIPEIYNCIVYGNSAVEGGNEIHLQSANLSPDFFNCIIKDPPASFSGEEFTGQYVNCLEADPMFVAPSAGSGPGFDGLHANWSLSRLSPCMNQGTVDGIQSWLSTYDNLGNKRINYGEIDIGAIEYQNDYIEVSDNITNDTIWYTDTIRIMNSVSISSGATLTILPGTTVQFNGHYNLDIQGTLLAMGSKDEKILFTINDTTGFSDVTSTDGGWGGIDFNETPNINDTSRFIHCVFEYGKAGSQLYGGAIYASKFSKTVIDSCLFNRNIADRGGAIACDKSDMLIRNSTIMNNLAGNGYLRTTMGGGIYLWESSAKVENCLITNNMSEEKAGAIFIYNVYSDPLIINTIISNNSSGSNFSAVFYTGNNASLIHNTICHNTGYAISIKANTRIINTIIWGNESQIIQFDSDKIYDISNCNIEGGIDKYDPYILGVLSNNIDQDPHFVHPSMGTGIEFNGLDADWSIDNFSPCVDLGSEEITGIPERDVYGNPRINNAIPDIGAVENTASQLFLKKHPEDQIACENETIRFFVQASDTAQYQWQKDNLNIPGENSDELILDDVSLSQQGVYKCVISNAYGEVESQSAYLIVNEVPKIQGEPQDHWIGDNREIRLNSYIKGSNIEIQWTRNDTILEDKYTPELIIEDAGYEDEGKYQCIISSSCGSDTSREALVYFVPQICMVTVDPATGNNLVIWEKASKAPLDVYNIYREGKAAGIYDLMGTVGNEDFSVFVDTTADPTIQAYLYKITGVDTSGFETDMDLCSPHKTIHLLVSTNPELNTTQLEWDRYYGFEYQTYTIYRSPTKTGFTPIHDLASTLNSWTDPSPLPDVGYYRLAALKPVPCNPSGGIKKVESGPYSHSMSNIEDNRLQEAGENQAPESIQLSNYTISENQSVGTLVGRLATTDPDSADNHIYKLVPGEGDDDNITLTTMGDLLITAEILDYETRDTLHIRIKSTDKGDLSVENTFIILVTDVDEGTDNVAPTDITLSVNTIDENKVPLTVIGRFQTDDPNPEDLHTYKLVEGLGGDDNNSFILVGDALFSAEIFDYESKAEYFIRVQSRDNGDGLLTFEESFSIFVNDLLEVDITDFKNETGALVIYPNPFNASTVIQFNNPEQARYCMYITDLAGKVVYTEDNIHTGLVEFNRRELANGIYFIELYGPQIFRGKVIIE